jgi:hypothetical protein
MRIHYPLALGFGLIIVFIGILATITKVINIYPFPEISITGLAFIGFSCEVKPDA